MALSTIPKVRRDGTIQLIDGTGSPVVLDVQYEEGNLTLENISAAAEDQTVIRDRGVITTVRKGDEQPITGSFTAFFRQFTSGTAGAILDFINKTGAFAGNTSTGGGAGVFVEFYTVDLKYTSAGLAIGDDADSTVTLSKCVVTASFSEGDPSTFTLNFTCYNGATYTGTT